MAYPFSYSHQFNYREVNGKSFPILQLRISNPQQPELGIDIDTYIDSGAEYSILNGWIATSLGIALLSGEPRWFGTTIGNRIEGRRHRVRLFHPDLGSFDLEVALSTQDIRRDLLGRDFFNLV